MVSAVPPEAYGSALSISNVTVIAPPATEPDCCRLAKIGIAVVPLGPRSRNVGGVSANDVCPSTASLASASDAMKTRPSCASARSQSATNSAPSRVPLAPRYPPAATRATLPALSRATKRMSLIASFLPCESPCLCVCQSARALLSAVLGKTAPGQAPGARKAPGQEPSKTRGGTGRCSGCTPSPPGRPTHHLSPLIQ